LARFKNHALCNALLWSILKKPKIFSYFLILGLLKKAKERFSMKIYSTLPAALCCHLEDSVP